MKFNFIFLIYLPFLCIHIPMMAQHKAIDNGFSIITSFGMPKTDYGLKTTVPAFNPGSGGEISDTSQVVSLGMDYSMMYGLKLGTRWYICPGRRFGVGFNAYWLDIAFAHKKEIHAAYTHTGTSADLSFLQIGPIVSIGFTDLIAIDAYYSLRPTMMFYLLDNEIWDNYSSSSTTTQTYGFGLTHGVGTCLRIHVLTIGVEYVFGEIEAETDFSGFSSRNSYFSANTLRILLGAKF